MGTKKFRAILADADSGGGYLEHKETGEKFHMTKENNVNRMRIRVSDIQGLDPEFHVMPVEEAEGATQEPGLGAEGEGEGEGGDRPKIRATPLKPSQQEIGEHMHTHYPPRS